MPNGDRQGDEKITVREFDARMAEVRRAVDLASGTAQGVALREYVEALFTEGQRATEMAEREREKAAQALDAERRTSADMAERERSKAAEVQATKFATQIVQGDVALKDHIQQQIMQLQIMLESTRREMELQFAAFQKAVDKSEGSYDKRFDGINELRAQMSDLISAHASALQSLTATLMPREVAESRIAEMSAKIDANTSRIDRMDGHDDGEAGFRQRGQFATSTLIAVAVAIVGFVSLVVIIANYASSH